ncbi:MAG: L-fucose:H+ symporter permease, partial [Chitinophagaceae bacterium]
QLTDTQSSFVDGAVYMAYFSIALPAGWFMHRYGYKKGVLFGLLLYGVGSLLFIPAAGAREYYLFLIALFIAASGATFLETVANPYITKLGDPTTATQRLNFAQSFNGIGAVVAPIVGGQMILSGVEYSKEELQQMDPAALAAYLDSEVATVKLPYLVIGIIVFILLVFFFFTKLPEVREKNATASSKFSFSVFRYPQLKWAVIAQFFYVGAQTCVFSFFIRFAKFTDNMGEKQAAFIWGFIAMVGFMIGRFAGTFLMRYIKPARLLGIYSLISIGLLALVITMKGAVAVYALVGVPFFMSVMFPTIFSMGITGLGEETKIASSFIVMAIVGGAIFPLLMGRISDATGGNIQVAYIIPAACFAVIALFAYRFRNLSPSAEIAHP